MITFSFGLSLEFWVNAEKKDDTFCAGVDLICQHFRSLRGDGWATNIFFHFCHTNCSTKLNSSIWEAWVVLIKTRGKNHKIGVQFEPQPPVFSFPGTVWPWCKWGHGERKMGGGHISGTMNAMPDKAILSTPQQPQSARENGLLFASLSLHSRATAEAVARLQCRNDFPSASLRRGTGKPTNCPLARALPLTPQGALPL
jgi:hypothetical protein